MKYDSYVRAAFFSRLQDDTFVDEQLKLLEQLTEVGSLVHSFLPLWERLDFELPCCFVPQWFFYVYFHYTYKIAMSRSSS